MAVLEMDEENQLKFFARLIRGLNCHRDLSNLLDHRLRICASCLVKPVLPVLDERALMGLFVWGLLSFAIPWTILTVGTTHI